MTHPQGRDEIVTCERTRQYMGFPIIEHGRPIDMNRLKLFTCEAIIFCIQALFVRIASQFPYAGADRHGNHSSCNHYQTQGLEGILNEMKIQ